MISKINHSAIKFYRFTKEKDGWYIDLPKFIEQSGDKRFLHLTDGADEILSIIARRKKHVHVSMDTTSFDGADLLELDELCDAPKGGGYYIMRTLRGKMFNRRIWLCDITLLLFGDMPERLYVRKIHDTAAV